LENGGKRRKKETYRAIKAKKRQIMFNDPTQKSQKGMASECICGRGSAGTAGMKGKPTPFGRKARKKQLAGKKKINLTLGGGGEKGAGTDC